MATMGDKYCNYCDKTFSSISEAIRHEGNNDHCMRKYKFENSKRSSSDYSSSNSSSPATFSDDNDDGDSIDVTLSNNFISHNKLTDVYTCAICDTFTTGITPCHQHIIGSKHQKKLKNRLREKDVIILSERLKSRLEISEIIDDDENEVIRLMKLSGNAKSLMSSTPIKESKPIENVPFDITFPYNCEPCGKKFTGDEPLTQHLDSLLHAKKVKKLFQQGWFPTKTKTDVSLQSSVVSSTSSSSGSFSISNVASKMLDETSMNGVDPNFPYVCEPCGKKFTGEDPFKQHIESAVHQKKVNMASAGISMQQSFFCNVCGFTFSGPIPYEQHLDSLKHEKQVKKREMYGRMGANFNTADSTTTEASARPIPQLTAISDSDQKTISKLSNDFIFWQQLKQMSENKGTHNPKDIRCIGVDDPI